MAQVEVSPIKKTIFALSYGTTAAVTAIAGSVYSYISYYDYLRRQALHDCTQLYCFLPIKDMQDRAGLGSLLCGLVIILIFFGIYLLLEAADHTNLVLVLMGVAFLGAFAGTAGVLI